MNKAMCGRCRVVKLLAWSVLICGVCRPAAAEQIFTQNLKIQTGIPILTFESTQAAPGDGDWSLSANTAGVSFFRLQDIKAGTFPFHVDQGLPNNALRVTKSSALFFSNPIVGIGGIAADGRNLHIRSSSSGASGASSAAIIRMDSDAAGILQVWEIISNSNELTFRDGNTGNGFFNSMFRIRKGGPNNTLVLDSTGNVGMGISNPLRTLHLRDSLQPPTLRFEDASANQQSWDIKADQFGFSLVDLGNVNIPDLVITPFAVDVDTPSNTLRLKSTGHVGIGTASPGARLHVVQSAVSGAETVARFQVSDDTFGTLLIGNASSGNGIFIPKIQGTSASQNAALIMEGQITNDVGASPAIVYNAFQAGAGALVTRPLVVYRNNGVAKVTVAANGDVFATSFNPASSRALKDRIVNLESRKAAEALRHLTPVEYVYKADPTAKHRVGFIAEDVPELVANADRQSVPIMDVVAVLTRVVQDQDRQLREEQDRNARQQKLLDEQRAADAELRQMLAALNQRMTELEQQLRSVAAPAK